MKHNPNHKRPRQQLIACRNRYEKQLRQARQERAAAASFILTIGRWDEFEQYIDLTCCRDYERQERRIIQMIERARHTLSLQRRAEETYRQTNPCNATRSTDDGRETSLTAANIAELKRLCRTTADYLKVMSALKTLVDFASGYVAEEGAPLLNDKQHPMHDIARAVLGLHNALYRDGVKYRVNYTDKGRSVEAYLDQF